MLFLCILFTKTKCLQLHVNKSCQPCYYIVRKYLQQNLSKQPLFITPNKPDKLE